MDKIPSAAELQPLIKRFSDALAVVIDGLAPLANQQKPSDEDNLTPPVPGALPRAEELIRLLGDNDTAAETVIAEIRAAWSGNQPAWLIAIAQAIEALDYPAALERVRAVAPPAPRG